MYSLGHFGMGFLIGTIIYKIAGFDPGLVPLLLVAFGLEAMLPDIDVVLNIDHQTITHTRNAVLAFAALSFVVNAIFTGSFVYGIGGFISTATHYALDEKYYLFERTAFNIFGRRLEGGMEAISTFWGALFMAIAAVISLL